MPDIPEKINLANVNSRQVDPELLNELRDLFVKAEEQKERYDFTWNGKAKAYFEAAAPTTKTLRAQPEKSVNFENSENLFITGDNLETLKLLQESYLGKIDMIYIDPPYNTGKDFVYQDNFKKTQKENDVSEGIIDEDGNRLVKNEKSNGRYHSDWLTMMYPRLKLARNLLSDTGVIFVSIDDNEQANLKLLMDEVFGEDNFRNTIVVRRRSKSLNLQFADQGLQTYNVGAEYALVYSKTKNALFNPIRKKKEGKNLKGSWNVFWSNADRPTMRYDLLGFTPETGQWRWSKDKALEAVDNYLEYLEKFEDSLTLEKYAEKHPNKKFIRRIENGVGKNGGVQYYVAPSNTSLRSSNWIDIEVSQISKEFNLPFENPKNIVYIMEILKSKTDKESLILDFFAGSGTTADAVMRLNSEDGGNRKFIVATLDEETPENSEARKAGYTTIDQISRERIRRAAEKISDTSGFRALKVDSTGLKEDVFKTAGELDQVDLLQDIDNHSDNRSDYDLLYDVLVDGALEYNRPITIDMMNNEKIIKYDYLGELSGVVCYFGENLTDELTRQIATLKPLLAVFKESTFDKSAQKVNVMEQFRIISPDTKVKVI
ncbi:site-specific DNA-methyltransferase [Enterococcus faecalis]|uniref:site-specific DNA-methyltransferase n=1 Tax=Enterococcus faecalis TaxID=1351 RepID=UPI0018916981|nr:site-specific DNA-methyltransferase [Enterococcus faecalis]QPB60905.1 site-specific DNA-methyltransferase [Enterococcus faecalis]